MSQSPPDHTLVVYSDFVCPFCYLGRASLRRYLDAADDPPAVEWRPFDLRGRKRGPDGEIRDDVDDGKDEDYYAQVRENVDRLREEYGAAEMLGLDEAPDVDSWDAQQVSLHVANSYDADTHRAFVDAVFDAHWRDGRDIGDVDVLADLASSAGVDAEEARDAVADEALGDELSERFREPTRRGVSGVPTFVYEGYAASGAVPPEHLERLVSE